MKELTIIHDNGILGQVGASEYNAVDVQQAGGLDALLSSYRAAGIRIIKTVIIY